MLNVSNFAGLMKSARKENSLMLQNINPVTTQAWKKLEQHYEIMKSKHMIDLFAIESDRFSKFSLHFEDMLVDFSKNIITQQTLQHLLELAEETELTDAIEKMFSGEKINRREDRAVLHVALRNRSNEPMLEDGKDVMPEVNRVLAQMKAFADKISAGEWKGFSGKPIRHLVNIGIGGSDLGPYMVTEALMP